MDIQPTDLRRLYGDIIYLIPEDGETEQISPTTTPSEESNDKPATAKSSVEATAPVQEQTQTVNKQNDPGQPGDSPAIQWRPKPTSTLLFILGEKELKDKELTNLLKKIVEALEIPFAAAGFGIITGTPTATDYEAMPAGLGVVFNQRLIPGMDNPIQIHGKEIYFTHTLAELAQNRDFKMELWNYLKSIKSRL